MDNSIISVDRTHAIILAERALDALINRSTEIRNAQWNRLADILFKGSARECTLFIQIQSLLKDFDKQNPRAYETNSRDKTAINNFMTNLFESKNSQKFSKSDCFYAHNPDYTEFTKIEEKIAPVKVYLEAFKYHDKVLKETIKLSISDFKFLYDCVQIKTNQMLFPTKELNNDQNE